jgi:uncharacterized protein YaaQ
VKNDSLFGNYDNTDLACSGGSLPTARAGSIMIFLSDDHISTYLSLFKQGTQNNNLSSMDYDISKYLLVAL